MFGISFFLPLAVSSGLLTLLELAGATVLAAIVLAIARAVMESFKKRQDDQRQDEYDQRTITEFFFDTPSDARTKTPAKEGWTTKVDNTLSELKEGQARIESAVHQTLSEVIPDGNGGHNLRGAVDRGAAAAGKEVIRIRHNEDER